MVKIFITGGTGFIGIPLVDALLSQKDIKEIIILVRNKKKAKNFLVSIISKASLLNKKITLMKGDITKENFGLSNRELDKLKTIREVFHLASNISLSEKVKSRELIFKTNFNGTKNLLEIFKNNLNLKNIYYFSSAYVCGKASKIVKEEWLEKPNEFRNHYEESKWSSEILIKDYSEKYNLSIVIFRPGIIGIGYKSQLSNAKNQTIYLYGHILLEVLSLLKDRESLRAVGKNSFFNMIPSDDLIKIIIKIRNSKDKRKIYNITNPINFSTNYFIKGFQEAIKRNFILVKEMGVGEMSNNEKSLYNLTKHFLKYVRDGNIKWENANTEKIRDELLLEIKDNNWLREHIKTYFDIVKNGKKYEYP